MNSLQRAEYRSALDSFHFLERVRNVSVFAKLTTSPTQVDQIQRYSRNRFVFPFDAREGAKIYRQKPEKEIHFRMRYTSMVDGGKNGGKKVPEVEPVASDRHWSTGGVGSGRVPIEH